MKNQLEQSNPATSNPYKISRIGTHWVAVLYEDGTVVLQYLSMVPFCGTEKVLDLTQDIDEAQRGILDQAENDRFAVRTLVLGADGSVACDYDAISPKGVPTEEAFQVIPPVVQSAHSYFKRRTGHTDW